MKCSAWFTACHDSVSAFFGGGGKHLTTGDAELARSKVLIANVADCFRVVHCFEDEALPEVIAHAGEHPSSRTGLQWVERGHSRPLVVMSRGNHREARHALVQARRITLFTCLGGRMADHRSSDRLLRPDILIRRRALAFDQRYALRDLPVLGSNAARPCLDSRPNRRTHHRALASSRVCAMGGKMP